MDHYSLLDEAVETPNGIEKNVMDIVEGLHLDAFIDAAVQELEEEV